MSNKTEEAMFTATDKRRNDSFYAQGVCVVKAKPSVMEDVSGKSRRFVEMFERGGASAEELADAVAALAQMLIKHHDASTLVGQRR